MKRNVPLKAKKPMNKCSKKNAAKDRAYRALLDLEGVSCFCCGKPATGRHHVYEQSKWPELAEERLNLIPICEHHHRQAHKSVKKFRAMLRKLTPVRMVELDKMARTVGKVNHLRMLTEGAA